MLPGSAGCTRMRLSAKGTLYPCLDEAWGMDLKSALRGANAETISPLILQTVEKKPERHSMVERALAQVPTGPRSMCQVGG